MKVLRVVVIIALLVLVCDADLGLEPAAAARAPGTPPPPALLDPRILEHLIGQKLLITIDGRRMGPVLAGRVRRGEIGGVVLLASNITTRRALIRLTRGLQRAATEGGQPPLLIAVDQEGGSVRRVPWAGPTISPPEMGRIGSTLVARDQGALTGSALRRVGINVDLAPVADIARSTDSFMYQQGRTFSSDPVLTASLADAFASGLASRGVLPTLKHFPGIGHATRNTDLAVETISASRASLHTDLTPYRRAIGHDIPLIMLSNARYLAYDPANAAGWSREIAEDLLRQELGFSGVTMTDSLNGAAHARGRTVTSLAVRAAAAGTDMILVTSSQRSSARLYEKLLARARAGKIPLVTLWQSYARILALKSDL